MSIYRVAERLKHGGHDIAEIDLIRRFPKSIYNLLNNSSMITSQTRCFLNDTDNPKLIFEQISDNRNIINNQLYKNLINNIRD